MKTKLTLIASVSWLAAGLCARAATNDLSSALQQGLFEEEANRNLPAAIAAYESLAKQFEKDRALAATAVFRLGECFRKQGQTNEAAAQYERVLHDFADQRQLATLSQQNLAGMGALPASTTPTPGAPTLSRTARLEQAKLIEEQIKLAEQDVSDVKKQLEVGGPVTPADLRAREQQVLRLRQQLAALDLQAGAGVPATGDASDETSQLASQLAGIEQLKNDPEKQARAVLALYPDADLKTMLLHLPKLQEQVARFTKDPTLKLDFRIEHFYVAICPGGQGIRALERGTVNDVTQGLPDAQAEVKDQLSRISGRVDFILGLQKARLQVLQSVAQTTVAGGAGKAGATSVVIDEEETEIRRLQAMIKNSPDLINAPTGGANDDFTPLGRAASKGQLRVAQFLLDSGAEVNRAYNVRTPLLLAAGRGHKAMIELLLARGADVNARNENGQTGLHIAAQNGFQATAEALVAGKADVNARTTKQKYTPLHQAVAAGHVAMVKFLLGKGADADAQDASGTTALMLVANRGSLEVLQVLLAAGAKPNLASESGFTALSIAAEKNNLEAVKALLAAKADPNGDDYCPLTLAIHAKAPEILVALLEAGADANRAGHITWQVQVESRGGVNTCGSGTSLPLVTPLFVAIHEGNADAVKLLLAHKADPNGLGPDRLPLILQAARKPAVLEALLAAGAKPNVDDGEGRTPLYIATDAGVAESVRLLLAHGADKEIRPFGYTPLLFAVGTGKQKTAEVLLQGGADVNAHATVDGRTPLHIAIERRDPALTELLLTNKADVNARDKGGLTPLDIAKGSSSPRPSGAIMPFPPVPPVRVQPPGGTPATPATVASPTSLADLLRQHGALDELPDFTTIRVTRQGLDKPILVFRQQTSGWNHFTLLETVLNLYVNQGAVDFERADAARSGRNLAPGSSFQSRLQSVISQASAQGNAVWFPDLKRIIIHRPDRTPGGKEQVIPVNLLNTTNGVDCTKDLPLEFGDVVEIPVRDHALSESPSALSLPETVGFLDCLRRKVQLTVRGQSREIELRPNAVESLLRMALGKSEAKSQLLSSSDLTRVKVTRQDPATGQPREFLVDTTKTFTESDELWLRDGDIIEVPEK